MDLPTTRNSRNSKELLLLPALDNKGTKGNADRKLLAMVTAFGIYIFTVLDYCAEKEESAVPLDVKAAKYARWAVNDDYRITSTPFDNLLKKNFDELQIIAMEPETDRYMPIGYQTIAKFLVGLQSISPEEMNVMWYKYGGTKAWFYTWAKANLPENKWPHDMEKDPTAGMPND